MSELTDAFNMVLRKEAPSEKMLVPLMRWLSGSYTNIENMQSVNRKFYHADHKVLILEVTLSNTVKHFIKYPKGTKDDEKLKLFYTDAAKYFGWTTNELRKNLPVIDIESLKETIARGFGYSNKERKDIDVKILPYK